MERQHTSLLVCLNHVTLTITSLSSFPFSPMRIRHDWTEKLACDVALDLFTRYEYTRYEYIRWRLVRSIVNNASSSLKLCKGRRVIHVEENNRLSDDREASVTAGTENQQKGERTPV